MAPRTLDSSVSLLNLFGDASRVRLLTLLESHELTVAELTKITELSQSRVSTHLGKLREAGLLRDRKSGQSSYYRAASDPPAAAAALWSTVKQQLTDPALDADAARCAELLAARDAGEEWAARHAGRLERSYSPGRTWESAAKAFIALLGLGKVLDVGCGDGTIAGLLRGSAETVTAIDRNPKLVEAARERLSAHDDVTVLQQDMHALEFRDGEFDSVLLLSVLAHTETPAVALSEALRVCGEGGRVVISTLGAHNHLDATKSYGHVNNGFTPEQLSRLIEQAGGRVLSCAITSRERRKPHFEVLTAVATPADGVRSS
ncbi:MAG: ArsR/SmtB family transcription factor [Planctomycetota bacterium]|jgi:ArsR family transcriptional regulator